MLIEVNLWWVGLVLASTPLAVLFGVLGYAAYVCPSARLVLRDVLVTIVVVLGGLGAMVGGIELMKRHAAKPAACACDPCHCNPCDCEGRCK